MLPEFSRRLRRQKHARRIGIPAYILYRRLSASGIGPRILINSIPKAGTHLAASMLSRVPHISYSGIVAYHDKYVEDLSHPEGSIPEGYDQAKFIQDLVRARNGTYVNGHLYWDPQTFRLLSELEYSSIFIYRDPRDICISLVHYILDFPAHPSYRALTSQGTDFDDLLLRVIEGYPASNNSRGMADLGERLRAFVPWLSLVPSFSFEEFVLPTSRKDMELSISRLMTAVAIDASVAPAVLSAGLGDPWSATIRTGQSGGWRTVFNARHTAAVRHYAKPELEMLGYEWP